MYYPKARTDLLNALADAEKTHGDQFDRAAAIRAFQEREVRRTPIWVSTPERSWNIKKLSLEDIINGFI